MFRPIRGQPDDNIFVTLGVITWHWSATAVRSLTDGWQIIHEDGEEDPALSTETDDFPEWNDVFLPINE
jgi:hypothetical protein